MRPALPCLAALLLAQACGVEESGSAPPSGGGGAGGVGGVGAFGGSGVGGSGGLGGTAASGGGGASGGVSGAAGADASSDALVDVSPDDAGNDVVDAGDAAPDGAGDGGLVTQFDGARIEVPCAGVLSSTNCAAKQSLKSFAFEGTAGTVYSVTLRFRGVVEQNGYTCQTKTGFFCDGATPVAAGWGQFLIRVADPLNTYAMNAGSAGVQYCSMIDYQATILVKGGAKVELDGDPLDGEQLRNFDAVSSPIVVANIPPAPSPFDGQFVQLDVVSITPK
ncbi:MAG: hypothetical protein IPI67_34970 [Myxococcales bacterium]|nr:hypothetical protein [Myxococcales bacterium]